MAGRRAKILSPADVNDLLLFASCTRNPLRNRVLVLLSAKAGLRASEIANLTWAMVVDATGQISGTIELHDTAAKNGSGRMIPMHPDLCRALKHLRRVAAQSEFVVTSERGRAMTPTYSLPSALIGGICWCAPSQQHASMLMHPDEPSIPTGLSARIALPVK